MDGRYVAAGEVEDRPAVFLWKLDNPSQPHMLTGLLGGVTSIAFSPDGRLLAMCSGYERGVRLWDFRSGRYAVVTNNSRPRSDRSPPHFSPDRTTLAGVGGDGKARLWSVNSGELLAVLDGRTMGLAHVAFSAILTLVKPSLRRAASRCLPGTLHCLIFGFGS